MEVARVEATEAEVKEAEVMAEEVMAEEVRVAAMVAEATEAATVAMAAEQAAGALWRTSSGQGPLRAPSASLHDHAADCHPIVPSAASCALCRRPPCADS